MASPDLNVSLGLVTRDFERSLKQVEKKLNRFSRSLERVGGSITTAFSVPVAAAGVGALRSAAKFEQLEKALIAVTGSTQEANAQLLRLQKIAEAPGIGFNQAVSASLQLQGLGVEAGRAEEAIRQVANVVAASGGGAQEFAGVVRQLNQIQAKNRVLQEDLNILLENAPVVGEVLQNAFGAKTAEEIRAAGVTGEEFFDKLVEGLSKVNRVEAGLFNTFENFGIAVEFAAARLGQLINETFGIQEILDRTIRVIQRGVTVFESLDETTRKNVLRFLALAVASGPVLQIGSRLINVYTGVFAVFRTGAVATAGLVARLQLLASGADATGPKMKGLGGKAGSAAKAFRALSLAQKLVIGGIGIAVITAAVAVYDEYATNVRAASLGVRTLENAQKKAEQVSKEELIQVQTLKTAINDETASRDRKKRALEELQRISPGYFDDLDTERIKLEEVNARIDAYSQRLVVANQIKILSQELAETNLALEQNIGFTEKATKNVSLLDKIQVGLSASVSQLTNNYGILASSLGGEAAEAIGVTTNSLENQRTAIEEAISSLLDQQEALDGQNYGGVRQQIDDTTESTKKLTEAQRELIELQRQRAEDFQRFSLRDQVGEAFSSVTGQQNPFEVPLGGQVFELPTGIETTFQKTQEYSSKLDEVFAKQQKVLENFQGIILTTGGLLKDSLGEPLFEITTQLLEGFGNAFDAFFNNISEGSKKAFKAFGDALKQAVLQLVSAVAQAALFAAILSFIPGFSQFSFGKLFSTGLTGGLQGLFSLKLAEGGIANGPTPAIVGEAGPEAIIPLSEIDNVLGSKRVEVVGMLRGEDIHFANRQAGDRLSRNRG